MARQRYDEHGIPILSGPDIEERAETFLNILAPQCLDEPQMTPLGDICTRLITEYHIAIIFGVELGYTAQGYKILGRYEFEPRRIAIDATLAQEDPRFSFTLAHELGHLVLHRNLDHKMIVQAKGGRIEDTARQLAVERARSDRPLDWVEWQANRFAGAVLLPRRTVPVAVCRRQEARGIRRGFGRVHVDWKGEALADLRDMLSYLQMIYQTSGAVTKRRLRILNVLVEEAPPRTIKHIGEILRDIVGRGH